MGVTTTPATTGEPTWGPWLASGDWLEREILASGDAPLPAGNRVNDADSMHARFYNPQLGRFLSVDPARDSVRLESPQTWNRYTYTLNNPLRYIDPDGRAPVQFKTPMQVMREQFRQFRRMVESKYVISGDQRTARVNETLVETMLAAGTIIKIHQGRQGKHVPGHNNFQEGKSEFIHGDPQGLLERAAGTGEPRGTNKELVDFGEPIGFAVDPDTGARTPTSRGMIHYTKEGLAHIVPHPPAPEEEREPPRK